VLHLSFSVHGVHFHPYELILAPLCAWTLQEDVPVVVNTDKDTEKAIDCTQVRDLVVRGVMEKSKSKERVAAGWFAVKYKKEVNCLSQCPSHSPQVNQ
jgi:hypothetical protein